MSSKKLAVKETAVDVKEKVVDIQKAMEVQKAGYFFAAMGNVAASKGEQSYTWFNPALKEKYEAADRAYNLCVKHGLAGQLQGYQVERFSLVTQDQAEWTAKVITERFEYQPIIRNVMATIFVYPLPDNFTLVVDRRVDRYRDTYEDRIIFERAESYRLPIPLQGLERLDYLGHISGCGNIEGLWVGTEQLNIQTSRRRLPDPALFLSFGFWLVPIAEWV